jgi:hypothetical protein
MIARQAPPHCVFRRNRDRPRAAGGDSPGARHQLLAVAAIAGMVELQTTHLLIARDLAESGTPFGRGLVKENHPHGQY